MFRDSVETKRLQIYVYIHIYIHIFDMVTNVDVYTCAHVLNCRLEENSITDWKKGKVQQRFSHILLARE